MTALGYGTFAHGGVRFPLTASTSNSLLKDADPALFYALDFIAGMLQIHIGDRLAAEGAKVGIDLSVAVRKKIHVEPSPVMTADQMLFPCLAMYRKEDNWDAHTAVYDKDVSTWELAYVLPPLTPVQVEALQPILRAAGVVIENRIWQGYDPAYQGGALIGAIAPIHKAFVKKTVYGGYQPIDNLSKYYRAIVMTLNVWERDVSIDDDTQWPEMTGADASIDETSRDGTQITDFVQVKTSPAPTVTNASPNAATKAGGTTVTLACTGLRPGTPITVTVGGKTCPRAVVVDASTASIVTPQHDAYDTYIADVVLTADDGQSDTLLAGFTFTTP